MSNDVYFFQHPAVVFHHGDLHWITWASGPIWWLPALLQQLPRPPGAKEKPEALRKTSEKMGQIPINGENIWKLGKYGSLNGKFDYVDYG